MPDPYAGERDLRTLLDKLTPQLLPGQYVFASIPDVASVDCTTMTLLATFREKEGLTVVVSQEDADDAELDYASVFRCITLQVHSSLDAVGLTAAVSSALADAGISANVIAAYYHDHVFVPAERADAALAVLQGL